MATAGDVPGLYDLVVNVSGGNTTGFVFDDALESSLPFRTHKATYTYSPTFIERQNVQGDFGDNQQDFFLTATQKDWSLGEQQRYFRSTDEDSKRRYWSATAIDVRTPGQASMGYAATDITPPAAIAAAVGAPSFSTTSQGPMAASSTRLYSYDASGSATDKGLHGLGAAPSKFGMAIDIPGSPPPTYLTSTAGGSVGVRKFNGVSTFTTFSASPCDSLAFLNNTLYGFRISQGDLVRYDTAGVLTSLFTWKNAGGAAIPPTYVQLIPFGGKLLVLRDMQGSSRGTELWVYDGTSPQKLAEFGPDFQFFSADVVEGTLLIGGFSFVKTGAPATVRPTVYYYTSGNVGLLWQSNSTVSVTTPVNAPAPNVTAFRNGALLTDTSTNTVLFYNAATGGFSTIGSYSAFSNNLTLVGGTNGCYGFDVGGGTQGFYFPSASISSSSTVTTSLFDFESSLKKFFRGITVEFDSATDGNGGTVDVAYRLEDVDSTYTSLATGVTSGTENTLSGITGKRISVKVTLNKGTSTNGPVLKRIMVRAAPILTRYGQNEYILSCIGDPASEDRQILRDGMSSHPLTGRAQADQLRLAAASTSPLTLTDRFRTYTGIIETLEIYEQHSSNADPSASGRFVVKVVTREI